VSGFSEFKTFDLWSIHELTNFCCGLRPKEFREDLAEDISNAKDRINRACLAKALPFIDPTDATSGDKLYGHNRFFRPADAARWARPLFPKFPDDFIDLDSTPLPCNASVAGNHISKDLILLNRAAKEFWSTADPDDKATHPTNDEVTEWLKQQGMSQNSAEQGATIIRPEWAAKGRR